MATVYLTGNGNLTTAPGNDFNLSDNANTSCTFYVENNATLNINGGFYMGKSTGGTATINQSGGTVTNLNGGGDAFSLGQSGGTGVYNMSGGALNIDGEIWVGNQAGGTGTFNQTAGTITTGGWFVVGRQGGVGTYTMSGGTLTDSQTEGGSNSYIGEQSASTSTMTVEGNATASFAAQFWVGENGNGVLNVGSPTDPVTASPSFTVNSWLAIGRAGGGTATGTLNLYDGTATQKGSNVLDIGGDGGTATGVVNVYGGTLSALNTWIGESSTDVGTLNMNGGKRHLRKRRARPGQHRQRHDQPQRRCAQRYHLHGPEQRRHGNSQIVLQRRHTDDHTRQREQQLRRRESSSASSRPVGQSSIPMAAILTITLHSPTTARLAALMAG